MQWITLVSTALGAAITLLATTVSERSRSRRERNTDQRKLRENTYIRFLSALTEAHEEMRVRVAQHRSPMGLSGTVHDAFRNARCYHARNEIALIAGQDVLNSAEDLFRLVRDIRDLMGNGVSVNSDAYIDLHHRYGENLRELQRRMRTELGADHVELTGGS